MTGAPVEEPQSTTATLTGDGGFVVEKPTPRVVETLTQRADFLAAARGLRQATPAFVVQARPRQSPAGPAIRVGFTCSKKVGNAVARNRAKRRLRALARHVLPTVGLPGWDYVLIGRAGGTAEADFADMIAELRGILDRLHRKAAR